MVCVVVVCRVRHVMSCAELTDFLFDGGGLCVEWADFLDCDDGEWSAFCAEQLRFVSDVWVGFDV